MNGRRHAVRGLSLIFATGLSFAANADPVSDCDALAGHPEDPQRTTAGAWGFQLKAHLQDARTACAAAVAQAPNNLRILFEYGRVLVQSGDPAYLQTLTQANTAGYLMATFELGLAAGGTTAIQNYTKAANAGLALAESALGQSYLFGLNGVAQDTNQAMAWLQRAVSHKSPTGEFTLATAYLFGAPGLNQSCQLGLPTLQRLV